MSTLQKTQTIPTFDQSLIIGFTKDCKSTNIPDDIINLCFNYYTLTDIWDINNKSDRIQITNSSFTICKMLIYKYATIVANQVCRKGIHHWRLKLIKSIINESITLNYNNIIGIVDTETLNSESVYFDYQEAVGRHSCYYLMGYLRFAECCKLWNGKEKIRFEKKFKDTNDIIDVWLDLDHGILSYYLGKENCWIVTNEIDTNKEYKLYVTINGRGTSFEILSYHHQMKE